MAFGRVALVVMLPPRPHTAASSSKAGANTLALADSLVKHNHDGIKALPV
jgi:hypothetical protein